MKQLALVALVVVFAPSALAVDVPVTVFRGRPQVRLNETGEGQSRSAIPREQASSFDSVISKIGDRYFWATRENREVIRSVSGVFVTFQAVDGSGKGRKDRREKDGVGPHTPASPSGSMIRVRATQAQRRSQ